MKSLRTPHALILLGAACVAASCGPDVSKLKTSDGRPCVVNLEGKAFLSGDRQCLQDMPKKAMSGYWIQGFEYSTYYLDKPSAIASFGRDLVWLETSDEAYASVQHRLGSFPYKLFAITFVGFDTADFQVTLGPYERTIFVDKFASISELPMPDNLDHQ